MYIEVITIRTLYTPLGDLSDFCIHVFGCIQEIKSELTVFLWMHESASKPPHRLFSLDIVPLQTETFWLLLIKNLPQYAEVMFAGGLKMFLFSAVITQTLCKEIEYFIHVLMQKK